MMKKILAVFAACLSLVFLLGFASAATPIYSTGNGCTATGVVSWTGGYQQPVACTGVAANQIVNTTTTSGTCSAQISGPNGAESCTGFSSNMGYWGNGACGGPAMCTTTNILVGYDNDTVAPNVTILAPAAGTVYMTQQDVGISVNATDDAAVRNLTATITLPNGTINNVVLANVGGTIYNGTYSLPAAPLGAYTLNVTAVDWGNNTFSVIRTFAYGDNDVPVISFVSPTETSGSRLSNRNNIAVNVTASDMALVNITISLFNSTGLVSTQSDTTSPFSPFYYNFAGLADGVYYFNATATDAAGNRVSTETRTLTIAMVGGNGAPNGDTVNGDNTQNDINQIKVIQTPVDDMAQTTSTPSTSDEQTTISLNGNGNNKLSGTSAFSLDNPYVLWGTVTVLVLGILIISFSIASLSRRTIRVNRPATANAIKHEVGKSK